MGPLVSSQTYRESFLRTPPPINRLAGVAFCHQHDPHGHGQHDPHRHGEHDPHGDGQVPDAMDVCANPAISTLDCRH